MNKLKDILYDKNDILVALLILAIAALIIYSRVDVIMDYSAYQAEHVTSGDASDGQDQTNAADNDITESQATDTDPDIAELEAKPVAQETASGGETITFVISAGATTRSIANDLANDGLISDSDDFVNYIVNEGLDTKIVAGTFHIPQGSSIGEIADILTH